MLIHDRDRQIVLSIARFGQLSSGHIAALHFSDLASGTPIWRAMTRLVDRGYVKRIERRLVGGTGAGSGQFVFQLGRAGHAFSQRQGKYWPFRTVDYHTLAIADAHLELVRAERAGRIRLDSFETEPNTHLIIGEADLRPDYYAEVADLIRRRNVLWWIEIDMGTERRKAIMDKLARYSYAREHATAKDLPGGFPLILFIAPDDARARELRSWVALGRQEYRELFVVSTMPEFTGLIFG